MREFRAIIDTSSPRADAEALKDAGFELLGPWAAEDVSTESLVGNEHEVTALLHADSADAAAESLRPIVSPDSRIEVIEVEGG